MSGAGYWHKHAGAIPSVAGAIISIQKETNLATRLFYPAQMPSSPPADRCDRPVVAPKSPKRLEQCRR